MAGVAFVTLPSDAVVSAANAQESTGLEWADARIKWQGDIGQLIIRIRDYRLRRQYCRRPHRDSKDFDEIGLQQLEEELALLIREFGRIQAGTTTATRGQSGASYTEGTYPEYRGHEVTDDMQLEAVAPRLHHRRTIAAEAKERRARARPGSLLRTAFAAKERDRGCQPARSAATTTAAALRRSPCRSGASNL